MLCSRPAEYATSLSSALNNLSGDPGGGDGVLLEGVGIQSVGRRAKLQVAECLDAQHQGAQRLGADEDHCLLDACGGAGQAEEGGVDELQDACGNAGVLLDDGSDLVQSDILGPDRTHQPGIYVGLAGQSTHPGNNASQSVVVEQRPRCNARSIAACSSVGGTGLARNWCTSPTAS